MPASKNLLVTVVLPAFLVLVVPYFLVGGRLDFLASMTSSWVRMFGLVPFAIGAVLILAGAISGLTASGPGQAPTGPYRYTRNPIMLGVLIAVASQYLLYDWPPILAYFVIIFVCLDCLIRLGIEPRLVERHGEVYRDYLDAVPRWLPRRAPTAAPESSSS